MAPITAPNKEIIQQWQFFADSLSLYAGDNRYDMLIRERGFEVKNMYFYNGEICYGIVTTFAVLIPYTILAGGYPSCMHYIADKINRLERIDGCAR
ncbi:hypothetical protein ACFPVY_02830 [Flavobacterium qiangtangense]|uniref:DUF393 domain-containing protein n=1 Tax=Flavobacterium qiangtangense TaxID=1442595 RepID=A0ABW1PKG1_9FLAO